MQHSKPADLVAEAERYLAAVELFRAEGRPPMWRPEPGARRRTGRSSTGDRSDPLEPIVGRMK